VDGDSSAAPGEGWFLDTWIPVAFRP
jgi:hypothetical protein